jgi:hypothetical protein
VSVSEVPVVDESNDVQTAAALADGLLNLRFLVSIGIAMPS